MLEIAMPDVICLGEALIDFIALESEVSVMDASGFKKAFGGAVANVAIGVSKLGCRSAFVGKVGEDPFGRYLERTFAEHGVDVSRIVFDESVKTTLAFVSLKAGGVPDFTFYRNPGADMMLRADDVDPSFIARTRIFHHGSISLISEPSRTATLEAARIAGGAGVMVTYDPNLRLSLWDSAEHAKAGIIDGLLAGASIVKLSEEELRFITGQSTLAEGVEALMAMAGSVHLVFVTRGPEGCSYATREVSGYASGFDVTPIDTTGAGDAFVAAMLCQVLQRNLTTDTIGKLPKEELDEISRVANAVGALATTKKGAIASLPTNEELQAFMRQGAR